MAVTNSATRTAMVQTDINPANDTPYVTLNPVPTVDLAVTKSVDRTDVPIGDQVHVHGPDPEHRTVAGDRRHARRTLLPGDARLRRCVVR